MPLKTIKNIFSSNRNLYLNYIILSFVALIILYIANTQSNNVNPIDISNGITKFISHSKLK